MLAFTQVENGARPAIRLGRLVLGCAVGLYFLLAAGYLVLRWAVWPNLDLWRPTIEARLSDMAGRPVSLARIETGFDGLRPMLALHDLVLAAPDGTEAAAVPRARLVFSLRYLAGGRLLLDRLELQEPRLQVERQADGRWHVAGFELGRGADDGRHPELDRLMAQRHIRVSGGSLHLVDAADGARHRLTGIDLELDNLGRHHRAVLRLADGGTLARRSSLIAEFDRQPFSRPSDWRQWAGELYAEADALSAERLLGWWPGTRLPEVREADVRLWTRFMNGRYRDPLLKAALRDVRLYAGQPAAAAVLAQVRAAATAAPAAGGGTTVVLRDVEVEAVRGGPLLRGQGEQRLWFDDSGHAASGQFALQPFELAPFLTVARSVVTEPVLAARMKSMVARGQINRFELSFNRAASVSYDALVDFDRVSLLRPTRAPPPAAPGQHPPLLPPSFENLSGSARFSEDRGELSINGQRSALTFPGLFEDPRIALDDLSARLRWQRAGRPNEPALTVSVEHLRFANADAAGSASGQWTSSTRGPGLLDLQGGLSRFAPTRVARYLPTMLPAEVRHWVEQAVPAGRGQGAKFRIKGDLHDFPYRQPESGEFRIEADVSDTRLQFADGWPGIDAIQAKLLFERVGMQVQAAGARVHGIVLSDVTARIADFAEGHLVIDGSAQGPAQDMLHYVNTSPLARMTNHFTADSTADGQARLQMRLDLPLADLNHSRIDGALQFDGNRVAIDRLLPVFSDVRGRFEFSERGVALRGIRANLLGGPVRLDGDSPEPGRFVVRAQGSMDADAMRAVSDNPLTRQLSGSTSYRGVVDVRTEWTSVTIESDLGGLASTLPAPLDKTAEERWPLKVVIAPVTPAAADRRPAAEAPPASGVRAPADARDQIVVTLRDSMRLVLERRRDAQSPKMRISRGVLAIDTEAVLPDQGFALALKTPVVDGDAWGAILKAGAQADVAAGGGAAGNGAAGSGAAAGGAAASGAAGSGTAAGEGGGAAAPVAATASDGTPEFTDGFSLLPSKVSIVTDRMNIGGKDLHQVVFGATRVGDLWRANVRAREVDGFFNWHEPAPGRRVGTLTARFTRLEIPPSRRSEIESLLETSPRDLPNLDVAAEEFVLNDHRFGALKLVARSDGGAAAEEVWHLEQLRIVNPAGVLNASGIWAPPRAGAPRTTELDYALDIHDAGALLNDFGVRDAIRGGAGRLEGRIGWHGSPLAVDYASLNGRTRLSIGEGQFLKTEPGIAKLIGVVNLQSLPRRLSLDFRDVFSEGFSFDRISGDVSIEHGVARTRDLKMRGVQAQVELQGEADIAHETQALEVRVRPELNAGLASLAYAAAVNPVIGLGSFVAQLVLRKPLEEIFSFEYGISGSWAEPVVVEKRRPVDPAESGRHSASY